MGTTMFAMTPATIMNENGPCVATLAWPSSSLAIAPDPLPVNAGGITGRRGDVAVVRPEEAASYLTTAEAARYLRKSASWLVKRHDIPYLKGVPNIYRKKDLDGWFERNMFEPGIN